MIHLFINLLKVKIKNFFYSDYETERLNSTNNKLDLIYPLLLFFC